MSQTAIFYISTTSKWKSWADFTTVVINYSRSIWCAIIQHLTEVQFPLLNINIQPTTQGMILDNIITDQMKTVSGMLAEGLICIHLNQTRECGICNTTIVK